MANEVFSPSSNHAKGAAVGGVSSADGTSQIVLRLDPSTKRLLVAATIDAFTGVTDGEAVDAEDSGTLILGTDGTNYQVVKTDSDGNLQVDIVSGGAAGVQYTEGDTDASITGTAMLMEGAADTLVVVPGTAADGLLVNLGSNNDVTVAGVATAANQTTIIGHVDGIEGLLTTIDADTGGILTSVQTLDNAISGSEMQVDVVASLPAGTNNIGDVDIASIAAGDNNIGNVDIVSGTITTVSTLTALGTGTTGPMKAEDAGHSTGDQGFPAWGVRQDVPNAAPTSTTADYSQLSTDMVGGIRTALYETDFAVLGTNHVKKYYTNAGAVTDGIVWSPAAGKRWYVTDIFINVSAAATVTLEDDLSGGDSAVWKAELAANSGWSHHFGTPLFSGEDAADLIITTSAGNVYVTVTGYEI